MGARNLVTLLFVFLFVLSVCGKAHNQQKQKLTKSNTQATNPNKVLSPPFFPPANEPPSRHNILFPGPKYGASSDPCQTTAEMVKLQMKQTALLRSQCDADSQRNTGVCSNYWASNQQVMELSGKFQRCMENQVRSFRTWAAGASNNAGTWVEHETKTRQEIDEVFSVVTNLATSEYQKTKNLVQSTWNTTRTVLNQEQLSSTSQSQQQIRDTYLQHRADTSDEESNMRNDIVQHHDDTRTLDSNEETSTRATILQAETAERTLTSDEATSTQQLYTQESVATRSEEDAQSTTTRDHVTAEETATRDKYTTQETNTVNTFKQQIAITTSSVVNTDKSQEDQNRALTSSEAQATRGTVVTELAMTRTKVDAQEANTRQAITAAHSAAATITQDMAITDSREERSDVIGNATATRKLVTDKSAAIMNNTNDRAADIQATVASAQSATRDNVRTQAAGNRDSFLGLLPALIAGFGNARTNMQSKNNTMLQLFLHLNLAYPDNRWWSYSWWGTGRVDMFQRDLLSQSRSIANSTVNYMVATYGSNKVGSAVSFLRSGETAYNANSFRSAFGFYRKAYVAATAAYI